ncbi:MAG TPA: hypothetical protein VGN31_10235, partial [Paraburkholderia sp.]
MHGDSHDGHRAPSRAVSLALREAPDHLLAALPAAWLAVFFLVPLVLTAVFSFGHSTFGGVEPGFTFDNYASALTGFYGATL